jgi:RND superfamily putative drug exporter
MGAVGRLAALPCGKVSKWIVLALWIVAVAVSFGPAGKLTGAQDNDSVSWLLGNAESTEVLKASERFSSPDEIPAVLMYERASGVTPADQQAVRRHVAAYGGLQDVDRDVVGPIPSGDGKALQVLVPINAGSGGWVPSLAHPTRWLARGS